MFPPMIRPRTSPILLLKGRFLTTQAIETPLMKLVQLLVKKPLFAILRSTHTLEIRGSLWGWHPEVEQYQCNRSFIPVLEQGRSADCHKRNAKFRNRCESALLTLLKPSNEVLTYAFHMTSKLVKRPSFGRYPVKTSSVSVFLVWTSTEQNSSRNTTQDNRTTKKWTPVSTTLITC